MDRDVRTIFNDPDPIPALIEDIKRQRPVLSVSPKDLESSRLNTGFGKLVLIVAKHNEAKDWFVGTPLAGGGKGNYSIEQHHIFPSSILYKEKYPKKTWSERDKVNEIANKAFITKKTNREIRNANPENYFDEVINKFPSSLESQFVPMDKNLWKLDNYEEFLEARRRRIAKSINSFIENYNDNNIKKLKVEEILKNDESKHLEFKSTLRVDTQNKGIPIKVIEEQSLKTIAAFLNQDDGGVLIIGVDDDKNPVGLDLDYNTLKKNNPDGFMLHLSNIITSNIGRDYLHNIDISIQKYQDRDVCVVKVSKAKNFVYLNGRNYVRNHNQTEELSPADTAEYIMRVWHR